MRLQYIAEGLFSIRDDANIDQAALDVSSNTAIRPGTEFRFDALDCEIHRLVLHRACKHSRPFSSVFDRSRSMYTVVRQIKWVVASIMKEGRKN